MLISISKNIHMAATLDKVYHSELFLDLDHLTLMSELIGSEYADIISKRVNNRLRHAKLIGCPQTIEECQYSITREYLPTGITDVLSSMAFIRDGLNICILGPSDSGKTHLAKALGIAACNNYKVEYHHCESYLEGMVSLKETDYKKYNRKMTLFAKLDLLVLDDLLLHTITAEREIKVLFSVLEKMNIPVECSTSSGWVVSPIPV
ncbi:IstB-like ATP binding protein [Anaerocolumna jejuensis DSM 15929]|uniref:IstB-like ATP binding protein n=2 Tax=Anaerocolumna TaxID=1843210 RepID=A0A1M6UEQ7_9FIRM|nr:IstB-like ATP binding protein [Anaerocolumna jejuensis DSM 15929]